MFCMDQLRNEWCPVVIAAQHLDGTYDIDIWGEPKERIKLEYLRHTSYEGYNCSSWAHNTDSSFGDGVWRGTGQEHRDSSTICAREERMRSRTPRGKGLISGLLESQD